ncbi:uncharacterized protein M6B38_193730 [Iris pallida]|uniref:Uncharacterized protein n=1 Tax=Iris pallida TaxID=29817 RepID=A0AAX6EDC3_IRIPA|nr:uncharacterized protein M6B38_193730 [Iris pallida]
MRRSRSDLGFLLASAAALSAVAIFAPSASAAAEGSFHSVGGGGGGGGKRSLLGFRESKGNSSFQCSPSGPCIPCEYSEKNDEKYRCSETGYRVPLNCVEIQESSKEKTSNKKQRRLYSHHDHEASAVVHKQFLTVVRKLKWRKLLDDPSTKEAAKQNYTIYRSCVPVDGEEKLSVLGFEIMMVGLLLVSGSVVYLKQKRGAVMPGLGSIRIPSTAPRF